jgi:hypothetical protein
MSIDSLLSVFDAWDLLYKAREPKGLAKWDKLAHLAESLKGKKSTDITFTTSYPGQEGSTKTLGSVEGNLHFLMGYANPAFHIAPYHYSIVDPNLDAVSAATLYHSNGHPSRPELWERTDLIMEDEGDLIDGNPHPAVASVREIVKLKNARKAESVTISSGSGTYTAIPSEGIVYGEHNKQVYLWDMVKESFFSAANPDVAEAMNIAAELKQELEEQVLGTSEVPELVKHVANLYAGQDFVEEAYPLVKSHYPVPSSVVPIEANTGELVYGIVTPSSIEFYDREGSVSTVNVYDSSFHSFDLTKSGDTYASVVYGFGMSFLDIPKDLSQYTEDTVRQEELSVVKGTATFGLEDLGTEYSEVSTLNKSVIVDNGTYRLVVPNEVKP